jgi:hypothetical protein
MNFLEMPPLPINNGHMTEIEHRNEAFVNNATHLKEDRESNKGEKVMVKRQHLLRDGMTEEHAWDVLYNGRTMSEEENTELLPRGLQQLVAMKARLSECILERLKAKMVQKARLELMVKSETRNEPIERFEDMITSLKNDPGDENCKRAFHVTTGQFEVCPGNKLFSQWETEYMDKSDVWICYAPQEWNITINKRKGCIYTVISASKAKLGDRLNAALKTTNKKVGVTREKHVLLAAKKHERRAKGVPLEQKANTKCKLKELLEKQKQAAHMVRTQ